MAQNKVFSWYGDDAPAICGMKADATIDAVDSYPAAEGGVNPGEPLMFADEEGKTVKTAGASDASKMIGIAVHVHREPQTPYYEEGYAVPVMTMGDIWVRALGDVKANDSVGIAVDEETGEVGFVAGADGNNSFGFNFLDSGEKGDLVRVRIRQ